MTIVFNNNITEIRVYEKHEAYMYYMYKVRTGKRKIGSKFFGLIPIYEKVYGIFKYGDYISSVETYNKDGNTYIEDTTIYHRPHCEIHLNNREFKKVYFDSVEKLHNYVNELKDKAPHIILNL